MTVNETIEYVENMSLFEKSKVYMDYYISMIGLKYNFELIDLQSALLNSTSKENKKLSPTNGMGKPDKEFKGIAFYYLWKDFKIKSFEDFCSKSNIQINDTKCDDWKERGFATKFWIVLRIGSIYDYVYNSINQFKNKNGKG